MNTRNEKTPHKTGKRLATATSNQKSSMAQAGEPRVRTSRRSGKMSLAHVPHMQQSVRLQVPARHSHAIS